MDWSIVLKVLGPLAGRAAAAVAPSLLRTWKVTFEAKRRAKKDHIHVKFFVLRKVINEAEVFGTFHNPSSDNMDALVPILRKCIRQENISDTDRPVAVLLAILADAYVHSLPPAQASRFEGERTRGHVTTELAKLQDDNADDRNFEANCSFLNPYRAEDARALLPQWPPLARAVALIVAAENRGQLLRDWAGARPSWLADAPAPVLCWLASAALDCGASTAAQKLLAEAIAAGASPRSYWQARLVLSAPLSLEEAEEKLNQARDHPLASGLLANLHGDQPQALVQIRTWEPTSREAQAIKKLILAQILTANGDLEDALQTSLTGYEELGSTGCALYAARLLLERGSLRKHPAFMGDLAKGLELASSVRASRRVWGGDGAEAAVVMITAYKMMGSPEDSLRTGTAAPEGTATTVETADPRVRAETARTAAELGMTERARELMACMEDSPSRDRVEAILVETESGAQLAIPLWTRLLGSISEPVDALNIGLHLAHNGQEIEWPQWMREEHSADLGDIDLVSELFRSVPGALQKARARAATSRQVFHGLMSFHASKGSYAEAAEVAEAGGKRWNDPEAWLGAAEWHFKADDRDRAIQAAEQAVRVGGTGWLRERRARIILIESRSAQGQWDKALIEATRLFDIEPNNDSSKWAFITCQYMTADYEGAWESLRRLGPLSPRTADDARMWIQLYSRFAASMDFLQEATNFAEQWAGDEQLRATIVVSLIQSQVKPESENQSAQYQELFKGFIDDFPDSSIFRAITSDDDDPVESMRALLLEHLDSREDALKPILKGELPVGMATHLSGKSYGEVSLVRGAGKVFAGDPTTLDAEVELIRRNFDKHVVIDTTALSTLSLLDPQTGREWLGLFASGLLPLQAIHDLQTAAVSLSAKSTLSMSIDKASGALRFSEISDHEAARRAERAEAMLAMGKELDAVSHPEITQIPQLNAKGSHFHWLLALDLAKARSLAFWCDDRVLRGVAKSMGVKSFGTPALLETMRRDGLLTPSEVDLYEAELIHSYYTGIRFSPSVMELAAELDGWMPLGVATAASEAGPTTSPKDLITFVLRALRRCTARPEAIEAWVSVGAIWLDSVSADAESATDNLRLWFTNILQQEWVSSSSLPFVLAGLRSLTAQKADVGSVVPDVLGEYYGYLADRTDHATAAQYVRDLIQLAPASDRSAVLQRIITQ